MSSLFKIFVYILVGLGIYAFVNHGFGFEWFGVGGQVNRELDETKIVRNLEGKAEIDKPFDGTVDEVIHLANIERESRGLKKLEKNELLMQSARAKAEDMKSKNYFEHISPDGLSPWFFVEKTGYRYKTVGENLAEGYLSDTLVHAAWMESPGHRENILSENYEEIGVAILEINHEGRKSYLAVQHFGSQLKPEDLKTAKVCDKLVQHYCEDAKAKRKELNKAIDKQENIISDAREEGLSEKDLREPLENLEKLEDIKKEVKDYLKKCEEYLDECE